MTLEQNIRCAVLKDLAGRSGFDNWWDSIDASIKREIRNDLDVVIGNELRKAEG